MTNTRILIRRAASAGFLLALGATLLGAGPSGATETFAYGKSTIVSASTLQYSPTFTYQDLATARHAKVGITPIPIP